MAKAKSQPAETDRVTHPSVHAALVHFQAECGSVPKAKKHQQGYKYADLEAWVDMAKPLLERHGLAFVPSFNECQDAGTYETKSSTWARTRVHAVAILYHESGTSINFEAWGEGADPADKGVYKAMTGARKYLLASLTGSATTDDPEADTRDQDRKPAAQPKTVQSEPGRPTVPPAAKGTGPAAAEFQDPSKITLAQAQDAWRLFKARCVQVAPKYAPADVQLAFRGVLFAVAGVTSTKDIPKPKVAAFIKVIAGWLPPEVEGARDNDDEGADEGPGY